MALLCFLEIGSSAKPLTIDIMIPYISRTVVLDRRVCALQCRYLSVPPSLARVEPNENFGLDTIITLKFNRTYCTFHWPSSVATRVAAAQLASAAVKTKSGLKSHLQFRITTMCIVRFWHMHLSEHRSSVPGRAHMACKFAIGPRKDRGRRTGNKPSSWAVTACFEESEPGLFRRN
jgi:hypothetical protein